MTSGLAKACKQVLRGVAFLDACGPRNWRPFIDTERLLMQHASQDILGQLYTNYWIAREILHLSARDAQRYGFESSDGVEFADLTKAWRFILRRRK